MQLHKIDPVSLQHVTELDKAPCLEIGEGEHVIKLYFQSEINKRVFMEMDTKSGEGFR